MRFDIYEYTSCGGREYNEDAVGHSVAGESGVFVVADGLGGHQFGELASACVRDTLLEAFDGGFDRPLGEWLIQQVARANQNILDLQAQKNAVLKSTVAALAVDGKRAVWANVGDSRLYFLRKDKICAVTNDHSVAYKKYRAGEITREQIATDEDQSALLRTLGSEDRNEAEVYDREMEIIPGDAFLLCTDGMWEYIFDEEILIDYLKAHDARQWAELLLLRLMNRITGGNDNLTALTLIVN